MDEAQIESHVLEYAAHYPGIITLEQAAAIAQVAVKTIYHWSSMGRLNAFKSKRGRSVRLGRDGFVRFLLTEPTH